MTTNIEIVNNESEGSTTTIFNLFQRFRCPGLFSKLLRKAFCSENHVSVSIYSQVNQKSRIQLDYKIIAGEKVALAEAPGTNFSLRNRDIFNYRIKVAEMGLADNFPLNRKNCISSPLRPIGMHHSFTFLFAMINGQGIGKKRSSVRRMSSLLFLFGKLCLSLFAIIQEDAFYT